MSATFSLIIGSVLAAGVAVWCARRTARRAAARAGAFDRWERRTLEAVRGLLEASRRSSDEVLAALDRGLRQIDERIDGVLVFVPVGDELRCTYCSGSRVAHFERLALRHGESARLPLKAAEAGRRATMRIDGAALLPTDRFAIAVPMNDGDRLKGVACVCSARECDALSTEAIVRAVEHASAPYAIALEREADRADATYDGLTGLLAPRVFRRQLHDEIARSTASVRLRILSLWFIDTDSFKEVNDRFGHHVGDSVLQTMASLLQTHLVGDVDLAARNGGDEFCALLRGASKGRAIARAQAFCDAVRAHDFGVPARITASVGIATHPYDARGSSELLEKADAAMYYSKRNGRDRVSYVGEAGSFVSVDPEAASELSRSSLRWRPNDDEPFAQRSSH